MSEATRPLDPLSEAAKRVSVLRRTVGRIVLVGISGIDCAGKSTFAADLGRHLSAGGLVTTILHGDEFSRPRSERPVSPDEPSDYYESIDYSALFSLIFPAARSGAPQTLGIRQTDWERDDWQTVRLNLSNVDVLVVEGAFLFREGRQREFDLSLWLEIGWELALERAASRPRDVERFGSPTAVRERYETRYLPAQQMHLERDHPKRGVTMVVRSPQAPS